MQSEYLCTLQPFETSMFARSLHSRRVACQRAGFGHDSTGLYPPHVSVTGFFKATQKQAKELCSILNTEFSGAVAQSNLRAFVQNDGADESERSVKVNKLLTTDDGHVLLDVAAPMVAEVATNLAGQAARIGVHIRPKKVRHLSIASGRSVEEQAGIARIHEDLDFGHCGWNLVVSRLLFRSDVETLHREGKPHAFGDLLQLPMPCARDLLASTAAASLKTFIIPMWPGKDVLKSDLHYGEQLTQQEA